LNSEIDRDEALELARQQIEVHHRFLVQQDVDKVVELNTSLNLKQMVYLHAPIWFARYDHKGHKIVLVIDGNTGNVINSIGL
jgi:uncharacterized FlaG/YvyC family protein